MKRYIKNYESIEAMATINPQSLENKTIIVEVEQRNEGPIPHLHVYHDKTRNPKNCSYIRLDKVGYSEHHKMGKVLKDKLKEEFLEVMNEPWNKYIIETPSGYRPATGYEASVQIWSDTYEHGKLDKFRTNEDGTIFQLDYSELWGIKMKRYIKLLDQGYEIYDTAYESPNSSIAKARKEG